MGGNYKVTCDLFMLPYEESSYMLYAPRRGFVSIVNAGVIALLQGVEEKDREELSEGQIEVLDFLVQNGVLNGSRESPIPAPTAPFSPLMVTLFPTNSCNLRCRYCYADAGDHEPLVMDWETAVAAIDKVVSNAISTGGDSVAVGFHGGGEPLMPWPFIQAITAYAEDLCQKRGLRLSLFAATNGVLTDDRLAWLTRHFQSLNVSFDGLPHIQDLQRPLASGARSFPFVERTLKSLDEQRFPYGLRSTVTSSNVELLEDSIEFIARNYSAKQVQFEPVFFCGRCRTGNTMVPDLDLFYRRFLKCVPIGAEHGITVSYSGFRPESLTDSFCGVSRDNFSVTPDGFITACYEVTSSRDSRSETFFIGRIRDGGAVEIDEDKRRFLCALRVQNLEYCQDCFAKWHCAGECAVKLGHSDYMGARGTGRCRLNRRLLRHRLASLFQPVPQIPHT